MSINDRGINSDNYAIKMVILTRAGQYNTAWYNYEKYNNRPFRWIIDDMKARFMKNALAQVTEVLEFYDKYGNKLDDHRF